MRPEREQERHSVVAKRQVMALPTAREAECDIIDLQDFAGTPIRERYDEPRPARVDLTT
jgi:hypothetical protein